MRLHFRYDIFYIFFYLHNSASSVSWRKTILSTYLLTANGCWLHFNLRYSPTSNQSIVNKMEINRFQSSDNFRRNSIVRLWFICSMMFVFISLFSHPELSMSSMFVLTFEWECFYVNSQMKSVWTQLWHSIADSFGRILHYSLTWPIATDVHDYR